LTLLIVFIVIAATTIWAVGFRHRYAPDLESLLAQLTPPINSILLDDHAPDQAKQREIDDEMWKSMNGLRGVHQMYRNAGILLTIALRIEQDTPRSGCLRLDSNSDRALMLRLSLLGCFLECLLLRCFPNLPLPRLIARNSLDQYAEMCASVRAMIEYLHPSLVDTYDAVI
jgi:hypothetical protein